MIQQRQGLSFKIIVSLIRIHAFTVKLFRSRYEISWLFILISFRLLIPFLILKCDNGLACLPRISQYFLCPKIFAEPGYLLYRADKSTAIINDEMGMFQFFRKG